MVSLKGELLNTRAEMHAAQDGLTVGVLFALSYVYPPAATALLGLLGLSGFNKRLKLKKFIKKADDLIRTEQIQENPEYFVVGFLGGLVPVSVVGVFLGLVTVPQFI